MGKTHITAIQISGVEKKHTPSRQTDNGLPRRSVLRNISEHKAKPPLLRSIEPFNLQRKGFL